MISTNYGRLRNLKHILLTRQSDSLPQPSKYLRVPCFFVRWSILSNCYEYVLELVAFVCRIQLLRKARKAEYPFPQLLVDLGPICEQDETGHLVPCKSTHGRTSYIQKMHSKYPWATPVDWFFALEGWDAGVQWVFDSDGMASNTELGSLDSSAEYTANQALREVPVKPKDDL